MELFVSFFKIGIFSFGGGYAMISLLAREVTANGWLTAREFTDIIAVSQITPGPIAVNLATFVGFRQSGILGAAFATAGVSLPSLALVLTALKFVDSFKNSKRLNDIFYGLRPAVAGLIFAACLQIAFGEFFPSVQLSDFTFNSFYSIEIISFIISIAAFILMFKYKLNPIYVIIIAAISGAIVF